MTFTKAAGGGFKETSAEIFYGMATIYFHLIDVLHLSDQFLLYAVPNDVWSLSFGISDLAG